MVNVIKYLSKWSKWSMIFIAYSFTVLLGLLNYTAGPEIAFSLFYLIPLFLITWFMGRRGGILISMFITVVWLLADFSGGSNYTRAFILYWNGIFRFGFFMVVVLLLLALKKALEIEERWARIDFLTGISNRRSFFEVAHFEINRAQRYKHPFSFVYLDLDDFKALNDKFGHLTGDTILRLVATTIQSSLRKTDIVARLGGDEFAILLPGLDLQSTDGFIEKIQGKLLEVMEKNQWVLTFSMGAVTFKTTPQSVDEMISEADCLMYSSKASGKNGVSIKVFDGRSTKREDEVTCQAGESMKN